MTSEQRLLYEALKLIRWIVSTIREDRRAERRYKRMLDQADRLLSQGDDWEQSTIGRPPLSIPDVRTMMRVAKGRGW